MRVLIIIAMVIATIIRLTHLATAHPQHENNVVYIPNIPQAPETRKREGKDAFYGNNGTQLERDAMNATHNARLATKSGKGFVYDIILAGQDLFKRLSYK